MGNPQVSEGIPVPIPGKSLHPLWWVQVFRWVGKEGPIPVHKVGISAGRSMEWASTECARSMVQHISIALAYWGQWGTLALKMLAVEEVHQHQEPNNNPEDISKPPRPPDEPAEPQDEPESVKLKGEWSEVLSCIDKLTTVESIDAEVNRRATWTCWDT